MSDIIKNREIVLKDSAVIQESFSGVESNVNVFWYLEKVDNNVYPYEENHVVDYILGVYSHIDNYTSEIANDFPQDKIQYFMIHEPNFKYYPDPENIQVNIMLRNIYTSEKLANNTFNKSTRFTGNYNFNKIASLNKSDYEKFNGIPADKLQDIIDIIGDNRSISLCVDTPYFTSTDTNTLLSDTCYLYDETYQVVLSLTYPNGMDVVIPVNVTSDITGSVDAAVGVTPVDITGEIGSALKVESDITGSVDSAVEVTPIDISGTIDNAIEVTPIDITGSVDSAVAVTPNDVTGSVDAAVGVTPTDISGSLEVNQELTNIISGTIEVAVAVTPVDITGEISVAIDAEIDDKDITGNFVVSKKNAYIWNDPYGQSENKNIVSDIDGHMAVSDKDLPKNLIYYSRDNVSDYNTITEYPQENLNDIKMILDNNENINAASAFGICVKLTSLDVSNFDTSNVTNMNNMFSGCNALISLDVSNFDTSNVTNMYGMFSSCYALTTLDVSNFDTSNVTSMEKMFYSCEKLTSLSVSNFDTSKVTSMNMMFRNCNNLTNLILNFDISSINDRNKVQYMFYGTTITSGNIRFYNVRKSVFTDRATFINAISGSGINSNILTVEFIDDTKNLVSYSRDNVPDYQTITSYPQENLNEIKGLLKLKENAGSVFNGCKALTTLDLSNFDTSKVTNMGYMFQNCNALTTLDVSNWNTSKVNDMGSMFNVCNSLTSLDVSNWDTSKVNDMYFMFSSCNKLANLTLNFDMSSITATNKVQNMFYHCTITSGNIRFFNVKRSVFTDRATFISAIGGSGISDSILTVEFID